MYVVQSHQQTVTFPVECEVNERLKEAADILGYRVAEVRQLSWKWLTHRSALEGIELEKAQNIVNLLDQLDKGTYQPKQPLNGPVTSTLTAEAKDIIKDLDSNTDPLLVALDGKDVQGRANVTQFLVNNPNRLEGMGHLFLANGLVYQRVDRWTLKLIAFDNRIKTGWKQAMMMKRGGGQQFAKQYFEEALFTVPHSFIAPKLSKPMTIGFLKAYVTATPSMRTYMADRYIQGALGVGNLEDSNPFGSVRALLTSIKSGSGVVVARFEEAFENAAEYVRERTPATVVTA